MKGRKGASLETVGRLIDCFEQAEQAIGADGLQAIEDLRRNAREAHISAAFHCAFEAVEQQTDRGSVYFAQLRAIEDNCGALHIHRVFEFTVEEPLGSRIDDCRNQFDRYSSGT